MSTEQKQAASLKVVTDGRSDEPQKIFCGHCGRSPDDEHQDARVCPRCGMGVLLHAPVEVAPGTSDPFLVVDGSLRVCAVSRSAERMLGITETEVVNAHIGKLLVPADAERDNEDSVAALVAAAAGGETPATNVVVRPVNTFGVRYWARLGPCGPPNAAILVLADAG